MPPARVRPTQDRVREALFSMLGERIVGARFLDLYAGSGAVGIEAWSRGAEDVLLVERDARVGDVVRENVRELGASGCRVVIADAVVALRRGPEGAPFDIVFADPPYGKIGRGKKNVSRPRERSGGPRALDRVLAALAAGELVADGGIVVTEQAASESPADCSPWGAWEERVYGKTRLRFLSRRDI